MKKILLAVFFACAMAIPVMSQMKVLKSIHSALKTINGDTSTQQKTTTTSVASKPAVTSATEKEDGNITFKLLKVEGDKASQTVYCYFLLTNHGANIDDEGVIGSDIIDENGDTHSCERYVGSNLLVATFPTEVPVKVKFSYVKVLPSISFVKYIKVTLEQGHPWPFAEFRDLPITWK
ncbi:MAG: hypothetical protein KA051_00455 [Paludibacteraceae bacterium]|jgi:hypothetical protein|nr:hypothetical protein [Paludibacteraceae bacterium]